MPVCTAAGTKKGAGCPAPSASIKDAYIPLVAFAAPSVSSTASALVLRLLLDGVGTIFERVGRDLVGGVVGLHLKRVSLVLGRRFDVLGLLIVSAAAARGERAERGDRSRNK
jgi:hypothetical protein